MLLAPPYQKTAVEVSVPGVSGERRIVSAAVIQATPSKVFAQFWLVPGTDETSTKSKADLIESERRDLLPYAFEGSAFGSMIILCVCHT